MQVFEGEMKIKSPVTKNEKFVQFITQKLTKSAQKRKNAGFSEKVGAIRKVNPYKKTIPCII